MIEVIQELRDYLGPEVYSFSDEEAVHKVMCKALEYQRQLSKLRKDDETLDNEPGKLFAIDPGRRKLPLDSGFQGCFPTFIMNNLRRAQWCTGDSRC
jgi:hypothetical protein